MPFAEKVNPSLLRNLNRTSIISIQCFQRWEEAMNHSLAVALNDPHIHLSGLPGQHQGFNYTFRGSVLFIHIGKAGGSSVARSTWGVVC